MRAILLVVLVWVVSGCTSTGWRSDTTKDSMTDKVSCTASYGSDFQRGFNQGYFGGIQYYPFVGVVDGIVQVGVFGTYAVPVGDIQLRIDDHEVIDISYTETPIIGGHQPKVDLSYLQNMPGVDTELLKKSMSTTTENISKISSPYTSTSGEKAKRIIEQMKAGKVLKMRVIGFGVNKAASTTGEFKIDKSFFSALERCGI